jgi:hypothetical protein
LVSIATVPAADQRSTNVFKHHVKPKKSQPYVNTDFFQY